MLMPPSAKSPCSAAVLTDAGAVRVVLFGSVARGDATEDSDIDLIAIYDDIDYDERAELADPLTAAAAEAAGCDVDVLVTDRPEWRMRTTRVRTSLEARAALSGLVIAERRPGKANWGKEMVMPTDDYQEGLYRLARVRGALLKVVDDLAPGVEAIHTRMGDVEGEVGARTERLLRLATAAHTLTENSVKALIHVTSNVAAKRWGHKIEKLCAELPEHIRNAVEGSLDPFRPEQITAWHRSERYHRLGENPDSHAEVVTSLVTAACRLATYTLGHFGAESPARLARQYVEVIEDHLAVYDLDTGQRRWPRPAVTL